MSTEIKKIEISKIATLEKVTEEVADAFLFTTPEKYTEAEKALFKTICIMNNLNPFKREIYPVKMKINGKPTFNVITGYQVYLKRAAMSGRLEGWNVSYLKDKNGKLLGVTTTIHVAGWKEPFKWTTLLKEFKKDNRFWRQMETFMIAKVGIGQSFRLAFPIETEGLPYIAEELGIDENYIKKGNYNVSEDIETNIITEDETNIPQIEDKSDELLTLDDIKKTLEIPKDIKATEKIPEFVKYCADKFKYDQETILNEAKKYPEKFWKSYRKYLKEER